MLVLSRREGESIFIGDNIKVTVLSVIRGKVRIGIEAPRGIGILRDELVGETLFGKLPIGEPHDPGSYDGPTKEVDRPRGA